MSPRQPDYEALRAQQARSQQADRIGTEQSCPTRLMDGRNEIRCWLTAGHEGACK